jgi:hypothetical protein
MRFFIPALALFLFSLYPAPNAPTPVDLDTIHKTYDEVNNGWFGGELPRDIKIGYTYDNRYQAVTTGYNDKPELLQFNPKYNQSYEQMKMNMFHEACHMKTWNKDFDHGLVFQSCMQDLAKWGAFRNVW